MNIIRTVVWVAATLIFTWFAVSNWTPVTLVFGTTEVVIVLPVLLLLAVIVGVLQGALAGSLRRRRRARRVAIAAAEPLPRPAAAVLPSEAQPTIVPPGCG